MASLKQLLERAADEYEVRKAAAEREVVRWEAFSGPARDPRPYFFERYGQERGRHVARATAKSSQYAFDGKGRCLIAREPKTAGSPAYVEFFTYRGSTVESAAYRSGSKNALLYVARQKHANGRIVSCDVLDAGPAAEAVCERYRYAAGRLQEIRVSESGDGESGEHRFDVLYDAAGRMIAIRKFYDYMPRYKFLPVYWNPETAPSYEEMWKRISRKLVELIPKGVGKRTLTSPAYCLAIAYNTSDDDLPPQLAIGLESELPAAGDKTQKLAAWNPRRFKKFRPGSISLPRDDELTRLCDCLLQYTYSKSDLESPRELLAEVALELNRRDWGKQIAVTKGFVVFTADLDDEFREMYWRRDLKGSVPAAKLKRLAQQKML